MSLRDLKLDICYESDESHDQLLDNFYNPVLECATRYYRIAGFFSSSSLIVAAKGISGLIHNDGKMYLLVSPELSEEDYKTIIEHNRIPDNSTMFDDLDFDAIPHENLQALAWLLDAGRLEIKIVVGQKARNSLFHQKVGIVFDESGDMISFSGSINETAQAWINNVEEFKVFRSWEPGQMDYLQTDLAKFLSYWKNERSNVAIAYDIPTAVREKIIKIKPRDINDLHIMRKYRKEASRKTKDNLLSLFTHQQNAVDKWISNNYSLLMEMATGTGKTRTAIGCAVEMLKQHQRLCIIIATPQLTLTQQWLLDIDELNVTVDKKITVPGNYSSAQWKRELSLLLLDLSDGKINTAIVFTTHTTASSEKFIEIFRKNKYDTPTLFICDEVHAIGSALQRRAMLPEYDFRIGLSATPERMFDEGGTQQIRTYFGDNSFEFTIADALRTINPKTQRPFLNQFKYYPIFVKLTPAETKKYANYTRQIAALLQQEDYDEEALQRLYDRRSKISKNAENKFAAFASLLDDMGPADIQDTIVFVSDRQIVQCFDIMSDKKIRRAKITESESADKIVNDEGESERQEIISQFRRHELQVLVGMKCLDEGIDIRNARVAILMSSSTNPREYVQRVGRVLRTLPNKGTSEIYDFIVLPAEGSASGLGILEKEARRAQQIAENALNYNEVKRAFSERGVILHADQ
ncbi:MAG: DEAD/DEAH box helicase [Ruminococcaceae bacterium]|nr:DEAD/DEAH box helicase [Oscillospiraceae bacterium]